MVKQDQRSKKSGLPNQRDPIVADCGSYGFFPVSS